MKSKAELRAVWSATPREPGWLRRLWCTGLYTDEELDEIELIDSEFLSFVSVEERNHKKWLKENLPRTTKGWLEIFPEAWALVKPESRKQKKFKEMLEIARAVELEDVVSEYVELRRSSMHRMVGLCPFHKEKTPSFCVYTDDNHYYCFGCQENGDVIKFVRKIKNLKFKTTVRVLYKYSQS